MLSEVQAYMECGDVIVSTISMVIASRLHIVDLSFRKGFV